MQFYRSPVLFLWWFPNFPPHAWWESNSITVPPPLGRTQPTNQQRAGTTLFQVLIFSPFKCEESWRCRDETYIGPALKINIIALFTVMWLPYTIAAQCEDLVAEVSFHPMCAEKNQPQCFNMICFGTCSGIGGRKNACGTKTGSKSWKKGRKKARKMGRKKKFTALLPLARLLSPRGWC